MRCITRSARIPATFNSLGRIRINFPSQYGVYMHDTPLKNLFGGDFRYNSSGCCRVQNVQRAGRVAARRHQGVGPRPHRTSGQIRRSGQRQSDQAGAVALGLCHRLVGVRRHRAIPRRHLQSRRAWRPGHSADGEALSRSLHCSSQFCGLKHGATAASMFNYIVLKLLSLPYTYFLGAQTVLLCQGQLQDQLHVSRTHDVVRTCDEAGGYCAVCDRGDQHSRTIRRHGWSARGNAASLSRPGLCVSGPRSRFHFHFFERGCEPCTEQRYGDLSHGLCFDRPTTLDVAQRIPCICNVAGGRFGAQPRPMDCMVGICSQRHRIHRLYRHRPAILPRTHATNQTTLVRLGATSGFGGFAGRRGRNSKLSNWPDGKRRACRIPGYLHQHYAHSASARWRSCRGSRVGERRSRSCRIWLGIAQLASRRSAAWIRCSPHRRPRRFRRLECRCLCNTSLPSSCLITSPGRAV